MSTGVIGVAKNLAEAFNLLRRPLSDRSYFDAFYVERGGSRMEELKAAIEMDEMPTKYLFTGHRATGKTTELHRLRFMLNDKFFVVYFSAMDELEFSDLEYTDVLLMLVLQTIRKLDSEGVSISDDVRSDLQSLFSRISGDEVRKRVEEKVKGVGVEAGLKLWVAELGGRIKTEVTTRVEIRERMAHMVHDLIDRFDTLVVEAQKRLRRPLLIIVDDLEKADLERAEKIFYNYSVAMSQPQCKIIYTVPFSLLYGPSSGVITRSFPRHYPLPMISPKNRGGSKNIDAVEFLKSIIMKRVVQGLFSDLALEKLAEWSGGLIFDMIRMAVDSCVKAKLRGAGSVNELHVQESFEELENTFRLSLRDDALPKLKEVYEKKETANDDMLRKLLHEAAVLQYDRRRWYDVHPAVLSLLQEKGFV